MNTPRATAQRAYSLRAEEVGMAARMEAAAVPASRADRDLLELRWWAVFTLRAERGHLAALNA